MPTTLAHRRTGKVGYKFDRAWTERSRAKIKATKILKRLQRHALTDDENMSNTQIQAAVILLRKCLPDLTEHREEVNANITITLDPYAGARDRITSRLDSEAIPGRPVVRVIEGDTGAPGRGEESGVCVASESGEGFDEFESDIICDPSQGGSVLASGAGSEAGAENSMGRDRQAGQEDD